MATSLIQSLNQHVGKSPDEIVRIITKRGWCRPSELGLEWFNQHKDTTQCWYMRVDHEYPQYGMTNLEYTGDSWTPSCCSANYTDFCAVLEGRHYTYWIIPKSEYQHGQYPPGVTHR